MKYLVRTLYLSTFCFLTAGVSSLFAQAYVFRVLGVSGSIRVKSGQQEHPLKPGARLENGQALILEKGYCGLVHSTGKTLELKTAGTFTVDELSKKIAGTPKARVTDKYLDYVMGQLSKAETDEQDIQVRKITGSVSRGVGQKSDVTTAKVLVFRRNNVMPGPYLLRWEPVEGAKSYIVNLSDRNDEVIFSKETNETSMELDFGRIPGQSPDSYNLSVLAPGKHSGEERKYQFHVKAKEDLGLTDEMSPAGQMLNGILCEEKGYFLDALRYYETAAKLEPEVPAYQEAQMHLKLNLE